MKRLIILFICFFSTFYGERTQILFHLHDAGETNALLPVIRQLDKDYLILVSGISETLLGSIPKNKIRHFSDYPYIEPEFVVTGVATELQGEVLDFFKKRGVFTAAYWDNFNSNGESPYFKTAHSVEPRADLLLLPCASLVQAFPNRPTKVVGHPTLDAALPSKVILWIGGYGKEYEEAYLLFQKGIKELENVIVIHQHHPKTGHKNEFQLIEALALADLVVCHQSTAAFQALAVGKPVLHVIPVGQRFDSLPLQKKLANRVTRVEDFKEAVDETLAMDVSGFFDLMGIPERSTETCKSAIVEVLP